MAYVTFAKTGVTSLQLSRGPLFPRGLDWEIQQTRIEAENRSIVRVVTWGAPFAIYNTHWELLPFADYTGLQAFFNHANVNWCAHPFDLTDTDGTVYLARYWPPIGSPVRFTFPQVADQKYNGDLQFRIEGIVV